MNTPIVQLTRNLRRSILRGDPWIYRQALKLAKPIQAVSMVKVLDHKGSFVCWGFYSPNGPLAVRVLSLQKQQPNYDFFHQQLRQACSLRESIDRRQTTCYRLINGEGDLMPGVVCDVYSDIAVLQFDGSAPYEFWDQEWLANWLLKNTDCQTVYYKPRHDINDDPVTWGQALESDLVMVKESGVAFQVDVVHGQKTGFFLDQRENRKYVQSLSGNKSVLNLFSYSGGFSVYAGVGGATQVVSVDIAQEALSLAENNWQLNQLAAQSHEAQCADVFEYISQESRKFDVVICDPPSLAKSEKQKEQAIKKYVETFAAAAKRVQQRGHLVLSSCSSHISFSDFEEIIAAALSGARKRGQVLRVSGQGSDHPYPHACSHLRYLKFADLVVFD